MAKQSGKKRQRTASPPAEEKQEEEVPVSMVGEFTAARRVTDKRMTNRQKCLVVGGRSMSGKDRHLLTDFKGLMPHARDHPKLPTSRKDVGDQLQELCQLHACNSFVLIEPHRKDITYMWVGQSPNGPSVKFQLHNVHTADEIRMAGNCLKYSRPLLHFDRDFELQPPLRIMKSLLHMMFNVPRYHPKSKPFVDRIVSFFWLDGHIWVRHYQIVHTSPPSLLEIGPRFALQPVVILDGVCQGKTLWKNEDSRPPTEQRRNRKLRRLEKMDMNEVVKDKSEKHRALHPAPSADPLDMVFRD